MAIEPKSRVIQIQSSRSHQNPTATETKPEENCMEIEKRDTE